eukprot:CAMPEP_0183342054 /NCGR_PEP_ID=MMETSP0164_2-20130417/8226_1 /TAXON_ID=221442 /ORGANISM="Coccolithus pelagicus ssp braarudi, Strain PLY182g" /LENGTH=83 /DNA_ID=CAMNT_0025512533 /DNA_START=283 /DNA_END=531 /DNA_ORIENTATION=-
MVSQTAQHAGSECVYMPSCLELRGRSTLTRTPHQPTTPLANPHNNLLLWMRLRSTAAAVTGQRTENIGSKDGSASHRVAASSE